ncbi:MAG TPA: glycoside hydrolase family 15 protein [Usitatibacter sp.]|nr:glycoside hydrolase family 15 protein [Usitatibacter sp.]
MARIEEYAIVGDCRTAALVSRTGSIDWLCWPRFDSDACLAALLGTPEHGQWSLGPEGKIQKVERAYRSHTLVLETVIETAEGRVRLVDFMPMECPDSSIVRIVAGETGTVPMALSLALRFDYGMCHPWFSPLPDGTIEAVSGPDKLALRTPVPLERKDGTLVARFEVHAGERIPFVLSYTPSHLATPKPIDAEHALGVTDAYWKDWSSTGDIAGEYEEPIVRSLLTLKALTYAPTGGIVAAATTSLPESIGGARNWDYRYCWLRDATLTLLALMNAGHLDEARAWRDWLVRAAAGDPRQMQILYGLAGERRITEWEAELPGYEGSRPVRIGNAAHEQVQIDVYGEVMDALHQARCAGLPGDASAWALQCALLKYLEECWREPDEGIWEVRGGARHFTFSRMMAWVAFDRGIQGVERFGLEGEVEHWRAIRDEIKRDICEHGFDAVRGTFVQSYESRELDASLLLMPTVGFLPIGDPRVVGTVRAIEEDLLVDGLVLRYRSSRAVDGLPPGEGAFLACSFWLADAYVLMGRIDEARALFERLCRLVNDVGLLAEEYDPVAHRQLGNFPQAFSHISLLNTAHNLSRAAKPAEQRARGHPGAPP